MVNCLGMVALIPPLSRFAVIETDLPPISSTSIPPSIGPSRLIPFVKNSIIYVSGNTAHRTINIGKEKLAYIGVYPAKAGHDYGFVKERGFEKVLVSIEGNPVLQNRQDFINSLEVE